MNDHADHTERADGRRFQSLRHVFFDLDGTLMDSIPAVAASYRHAFGTVLGIDYPSTREDEISLMSPKLLEACERVAGARAQECASEYERFYARSTDGLVSAMPGAIVLLEGLVRRGLSIGIVTNKARARIDLDLRRAELDAFPWCATVTATDVAERKPHPAPLLEVLRRSGAAASSSAYVGDGPHDIAAAKAAGMLSVGAGWGYYGQDLLLRQDPDALLSRPEALLELIG